MDVCAAVLEYLSMLPSLALFFEIMPGRPVFLQRITQWKVICLPMLIKNWLSKICPGYDPYLRSWPHSVDEYKALEICQKRRRERIRRLLGRVDI
jgi:hypothetical protein